MNLETAFPERARRLSAITRSLEVAQDFPLFKSAPLPAGRFTKLLNAVNLYLYANLSAYYPERHIALADDIFDAQADAIAGLPNITPNGLLLAKRETYLAYNLLHAQVAEIFAEAGLGAHVERIHSPVNVRIVSGSPEPAVDGRPRASAKWHCDLWAGEPAGAIMVFLPILGDTLANGVRWIEPTEMPDTLLRPLADFADGVHLIRGGREYDVVFDPGHIALSDPFLAHATQKQAPGLRLSIDFRFIALDKVPGDDKAPGTRGVNYIAYADWNDIGLGRVLSTDAPLAPFHGRDEGVINHYAAEFTTIPVGV